MSGRLVLILIVLQIACKNASPSVSVQFRVAYTAPADSLDLMIFSGWGVQDTFYVDQNVELTETAIISAEVTTMDDHPAIAVQFSDSGAMVLSRVTGENVNAHLAMIVDGTLLSAPLIRTQIDGGRAVINGDMSRERAEKIARALNGN